jgi:hypothetical protein
MGPMIEKVALFGAETLNTIPGVIGHFGNLDGAFGGVRESLGDLATAFNPLARDAFNVVKEVAGVALPAALNVSKVALGALGTGVQAVTGFLASNKTTVQAVTVTVGTFVAILYAQSAALAIASAATTAWGATTTFVTGAINTARAAVLIFNLALAANPIGLVIAALAALAIGLVYAYQKSETFRDIVKGAFSMVLGAVDKVMAGFQKFFEILGKVPGFGWAKEAAAKIDGARDAVQRLSRSLEDIPEYKRVQVDIAVNGINTLEGAANKLARLDGARAGGGPVRGSGTYLVGEEGPELFTPGRSGMIHTAAATAAMAAAPAVTVFDLSELVGEVQGLRSDIRRLPQDYRVGVRAGEGRAVL